MPVLHRYRRSLMVGVVTILTFGWCAVNGAPGDNRRLTDMLHEAHRGDKFRRSLLELRSEETKMDECAACHGSRDWMSNLISPRLAVEVSACVRCHKVSTAEPGAHLGTTLGAQSIRKGHHRLEATGPDSEKGLRVDPESDQTLPLRCANCHPDHRGDAPFRRVAVDVDGVEKHRFDLTASCLGCHVPEGDSPAAQRVMKFFLESHSSAFENAVKPATRAAVLSVMELQQKIGERGCTPACHGEHNPMFGDG